jgi:hypothetical protein
MAVGSDIFGVVRCVPRNAEPGGPQFPHGGCPGGGARDHRIVAWAPGGDGLVEIRRAPTSGTAANATTVFGSEPHPATPVRKEKLRRKRPHPRPQPEGRGQSYDGDQGAPTRAELRGRATPGNSATAFRGTQVPVFCWRVSGGDGDRRIVAWAPGSAGLTDIWACPAPGRPPPHLVFGSDPNPANPRM